MSADAGDASKGVYAVESDYLDCAVQVGIASGRVISVSFPPTPDADARRGHPLLDRVEGYLEGVRDDFADVEVALTVPTDHRAVLEALRDVPHGEQVSVDQLVRTVAVLDSADESAPETARRALANNPVPLVIPDHRVRDGPSGAPPAVEQRLREIEGL